MNLTLRTWLVAFAVCAFGAFAPSAQAAVAPPGFQVNTVASRLFLPVGFALVPDGRIFVIEKGGAVRVIKNGALLPTPLVQLTDINDFADRGLEGIAVDPNFVQNGYIYLAYTYENTPGQNYTGNKTGRIVRLTVVGDSASLASKVVILGTVGGDAQKPSCRNFATTSDCIVSDSDTHSMGALRFGPDGKLYATLGDGAGYNSVDPLALVSQDLQSLGGKLVRINTDGTGPADNPYFSGDPNANRSKVWVLGLRNSYRFNFAPDGKIFFGDVGWTSWEEINVAAGGENFGWPCREGNAATAYNCAPSSAATNPIYVYDHSAGSASVIGGAFPTSYPAEFAGNYFFGDYSNSFIKRMSFNPDGTVASVQDFITDADGPTDIQRGADGNLYYVALNAGELRAVVFSEANRAPNASISAAPVQGPAPLLVHFSSSGSSDPDGDAITFHWDFGDGATSTLQSPDHSYSANGNYTARLTVTDSHGSSTVASAGIVVGQAQSADPLPHHVQTTITPSPVVIGRQETISATITNAGAETPFIVDIEIYNTAVEKVAQYIFENQIIVRNGSKTYDVQWFPPVVGDYVIKVGLFKAGWAGLYEWTDEARRVMVLDRSPDPVVAPNVTHISTTVTPPNPALGTTAAITTTVKNTGGDGSGLIDIEVIKGPGGPFLFGQYFVDDQVFAAGETRTFTYNFPVPVEGQYAVTSSGTYKVSVGIFKPHWESLYQWVDEAAFFTTADQAPPPSSGVLIYTDSLAAGWENWSWGAAVNGAATSPVHSGSRSMQVTYNSAWAGLFLHHAGIQTAGKTSLTFAINGGSASGQQLRINAFDAAGNSGPAVPVENYISGGVAANTWKVVTIPLADIGMSDTVLTGVVIQDISSVGGASVFIDEIKIQ